MRGVIRDDEAQITVFVDGQQVGDLWGTYSGGVLTAAEAKTRGGGVGSEISLGGPASRDDVTVTVQNTPLLVIGHKTLESKIGKKRGHVQIQYTDSESGGAIEGAAFTVYGSLKSASLPAADTTATSPNVGVYTLVLGSDETAG